MAANTVTIACKLPTGHRLDLEGHKSVNLLGARIPRDDNGMPISERATPGGFGLTFGVDKEFWEKWLSLHKESDPVKKGFIFAHVQPESAAALAKEMANEKTGLEPLDPKKLPKGIENLDAPAS